MKILITLLSFALTSSFAFASNKQSNKEIAARAAVAVAEIDWSYLGDRLDIQVFEVTEKSPEVIKVELGMGTVNRPARMHNCVTVTFSQNGYIENMATEIDSGSCD